MAKLNQIVAVVSTKKTDGKSTITELYHKVKKPDLFTGLIRTYETLSIDGEELPSETKLIQLTVKEAIDTFIEAMTPVYDTTLTQDGANTVAESDVVIDGVKILENIPVTHLLFIEKQLTDLHTFITHLPVLDPGNTWSYSKDSNCFVTPESWKYHTKKLPRAFIKAEATIQHPAQVEILSEDKNIGRWKTINQSGAIPALTKHGYLVRVKKLIEAVKKAREEANNIVVSDRKEAESIFKYIFEK